MYVIRCCGFESRCFHLNFRYHVCFELLDNQATIEFRITLKCVPDTTITYSQINNYDNQQWVCWGYSWRIPNACSVLSKHKIVVTTLSQLRTFGRIDAVSSLEMKVLPTSVDNVVATLKSDVVATLCQRISNVVTTLQSNFTKCLTTPCVNFASANTSVFFES